MTETTYTVTGMDLRASTQSVTEEISAIDGVTHVAVDLTFGSVTVTSNDPIHDADVQAAVEEAGSS